MENSAKPHDERDEAQEDVTEESKHSRKKASVQHTLQSWLLRRQIPESNLNIESDEEDDDDSETGKKTKRLRAMFRKLFGSQVIKEDVEPAQTEEQSAINSQVNPEGVLNIEHGEPAEQIRAITSEESVDTPTSNITAEAIETPSVEQSTPHESPLDPMVAARYEQSLRGATEQREQVILDRSQDVQPEVTAKEVRKVAADDYYRNRKRRREIRQTNERVIKLEKAQKRSNEQLREQLHAQEAAEREARRQVPEVAPRAAAPNVIPTPNVVPLPSAHPETREARSTPEKPAVSLKEILAQRSSQRTERAPVNYAHEKSADTARPTLPEKPEVTMNLGQQEFEVRSPEKVLQQVEKAAEENVAIEGLFERRHEVKDNDKQAGGSNAGGGQAPTPAQVASTFISPASPQQPPAQRSAGPMDYIAPEYKQAARNGFWSAIVILIFASLIFFIT